MTQSPFWRAVARAERYLPAPRSFGEKAAKGRRWWALAVVIPGMVQAIVHRSELSAMGPVWEPKLPGLALTFAGAVVVAVIASGLRAWRRAA